MLSNFNSYVLLVYLPDVLQLLLVTAKPLNKSALYFLFYLFYRNVNSNSIETIIKNS